jgi:hypothetical protein
VIDTMRRSVPDPERALAIRKSICRRFDARPPIIPSNRRSESRKRLRDLVGHFLSNLTLIAICAASTETSKCGSRCPHICQQAMASRGRELTRLRGAPLVAMVQAADLRNGDHRSSVG